MRVQRRGDWDGQSDETGRVNAWGCGAAEGRYKWARGWGRTQGTGKAGPSYERLRYASESGEWRRWCSLLLLRTQVSWKVKAVLEGGTQLRTLLVVVRVERSLIRTLASPSEWWALWGPGLHSANCCIPSSQARLAQGGCAVKFWASECFHHWPSFLLSKRPHAFLF